MLNFMFFFPRRLNLRNDLECGDSPARSPVMIGCYSKITRDLRKMKMGEGDLYSGGVTSLLLLKDGKLLVGTGDGTVEMIQIINRKESRTHKPSKFPNTPQILTVSLLFINLFRKGIYYDKEINNSRPHEIIVFFFFIYQHQKENVCSAITSMVLYLNEFVLIGTVWCEIYQIQLSNFHMRLLVTSHTSCIYSVAFPR